MNYTVRDVDGVREVALSGQLTFEADDDFRLILAGMDGAGLSDFVLEMSDLDFIDSAGLGLLVLANNAAGRQNLKLTLRRPKGQVRDMIELSEFHTIIHCEF